MKHILIVDDSRTNLAMAKQELSGDYQVTPVISGFQALQFLEKRHTDLILLDINMPEMDGKETMRRIKENERWAKIPIIFLTADSTPETEAECLSLGADDFIAKPFVPKVMRRRISRLIELNELRYDLETRLEEKTRQVEKVTLQSIMAIANTIDEKDKYTSGHSARVAKCAEALAERLGWSEAERQNLHYVALLHDIGKIGVPDTILNKPSRLTDNEFSIIKKHPLMGNDILKDIKMIENVSEAALYHHERYDGTGYPCGLKGEDIPLTARIVCIADAYDAMTSTRCYRPKLSDEKVLSEFERGMGTQFDPEIAKVFIEMLREGFHISDTDDEGNADIADESGMLLQNVLTAYTADMKNRADRDPLTGLFNRAYTEQTVDQLVKSNHGGSLFMIDIDNFKQVNDRYGHITGDKLLKMFGDILTKKSENKDVICRIGGDEFMAFYPNLTTRERVEEKAKEVLLALTSCLHGLEYDEFVSVSIGIAIAPKDGKSFQMLYSNADKALYHVKKNGKNSFDFYSDERDGEKGKSTSADLDNVRYMIEGRMDMKQGAFRVAYDEFQKIYNFISRYVMRNNQKVQTVLLTLHEGMADSVELESAMIALESSIISSLRKVDVATKYSSSQFVVILMDTDLENGTMVAERIVKSFYQTNAQKGISLSFDIQTMTPPAN